jgi:hypothetical protein
MMPSQTCGGTLRRRRFKAPRIDWVPQLLYVTLQPQLTVVECKIHKLIAVEPISLACTLRLIMPLFRLKAHLRFNRCLPTLHYQSPYQLSTSMTLFTSSMSRLRWNATRNRESFKDFVTPRGSRKMLSMPPQDLKQPLIRNLLRPDSKVINSFSLQSCSYL